jgi:hypothetical protein
VRQKRIYLACAVLHFLLILTVCCRDVVWLIAHKLTVLPSGFTLFAEKAEPAFSTAIAQNLESANPARRALLTYAHLAGIERGYGYFAANVPGAYKLAFELRYADGAVEYTLPSVNSHAAGLRVASLLDEIARTPHAVLREYLVKTMARNVWREHPDATMIRAVFGVSRLPSIAEFEQGKRESFEFLYAYEFSLRDVSAPSPNR